MQIFFLVLLKLLWNINFRFSEAQDLFLNLISENNSNEYKFQPHKEIM